MTEVEIHEFHILNFFRVYGHFASTDEMNMDFRKSGLLEDRPGFQNILDKGYLDRGWLHNRPTYKLNDAGIVRWNRLNKQMEASTTPAGIHIRGDVTGSVISNQSSLENIQGTLTSNASRATPSTRERRISLLEKVGIVCGIIGTIFLIWEFILKRIFHLP